MFLLCEGVDGIYTSQLNNSINKTIGGLIAADLKVEDPGHQSDYVKVNIKQNVKDTFVFLHPTLINTIREIGIGPCTTVKPVPATSSKSSHYYTESPDLMFIYITWISWLNLHDQIFSLLCTLALDSAHVLSMSMEKLLTIQQDISEEILTLTSWCIQSMVKSICRCWFLG